MPKQVEYLDNPTIEDFFSDARRQLMACLIALYALSIVFTYALFMGPLPFLPLG